MARSLFGGGIGDQVFGDRLVGRWNAYGEVLDENGDPTAVTLTAWSTRSGGVQLTDLRAANGTTPITVVVTAVGTGQIPEFYGPDGVSTLYLSADGGATRARFTSAEGIPGPPGGGDMFKATYDPEDVGDDAFDRANHHGEQDIDSVDGLQVALDGKEPELPAEPAAPTTKFLRGDRTWAVPPDTGGGEGDSSFYYPETYGAVGNGTTDDTDALQSAYDAARDAGGGTVILSQRYKWTDDLFIRGGVSTFQLATPQIETPLEAELGLVAGNAAARVRWGQTAGGENPSSRNDNPGSIINLLIDGNDVGGTTELLRVEGANSTAWNLSVKRSINNGVLLASAQNFVFYNLQISECFDGDALVLKPYQATAQSPGGNKWFGGHLGDSDVCLRVTNFGATDYPAHDNIFDGVIFETGRVSGHNISANVILESGETFFRSCVFTIGQNVGTITEDCNVLVTNDIHTNYSTVAVFDSPYFGGGGGAEKADHHVRVKKASAYNEVRMYGRISAANSTSIICTDGVDADVIGGIEGAAVYITGGYTNGAFASINSGAGAAIMTRTQTPRRYEMGAGQGAPFQTRRFGEAFNRQHIDRDGNIRIFNPTTGAQIAAILAGATGFSITGQTLIEPPRFTTALRPSAATYGEGRMIWDTDLDIPLWSNGAAWIAGAGGGGGTPGADGAVGPPGPLGNSVLATIGGITYPMDPQKATDYSLTLIGAVTLEAEGMTNGQSMSVNLIQDGVGGRVVTLDADWIGVEDVVLSTDPNTYDKLILTKDSIGILVKHAHGGDLPGDYFSPDNVTGQVLWIRADSIQDEDNSDVSALDNPWGSDLSTLVGVPATLKVLNGRKFVQFAGATSIEGSLGATTGQPILAAALVRVNHSGAGSIFDGLAGATNNIDLATNGSDNYLYSGVTATTLPADGDFQVVISVTNGASSKLRVDGTEQTGTAVGGRNLTGVRLARNESGGNYGTVDIAELILVSNATFLDDIEDYLIEKRDQLNGV